MTIKLTLPYPPTTNNLFMTVGKYRVPTKRAKDFKAEVQMICIASRVKPLSGEICVKVSVYRPRRSGDLDNTLKAIFDGLKGQAFHDDKQIIEIHALRFDDKENPRAEVEIQEIKPYFL